MNKKMKVISTIILIIMVISMATSVFAGDAISPEDMKPKYDGVKTDSIMDITGRVMGLIRNAAVIIGVIVLMVIGIKFMLGSAEEKAEYKKSLMPLVVGIVIVMAATSVMSLIFSILGG